MAKPLSGRARARACYPTLTYLAAHTSRIKLLTLATASPYWHPILLARTVTILDVLSGGRAWLGIGAGDYEEEARGSGLPFPPPKERYARLEEMLQICVRLWQGDTRPFEGTYYRIERPFNLPQSLSRPHPPILIAGSGEHKTLRLVARYADACNLRLCLRRGRGWFQSGDLIGQLRWLASMGIQTVLGVVPQVYRIEPLEIIGREIIPAVTDL